MRLEYIRMSTLFRGHDVYSSLTLSEHTNGIRVGKSPDKGKDSQPRILPRYSQVRRIYAHIRGECSSHANDEK